MSRWINKYSQVYNTKMRGLLLPTPHTTSPAAGESLVCVCGSKALQKDSKCRAVRQNRPALQRRNRNMVADPGCTCTAVFLGGKWPFCRLSTARCRSNIYLQEPLFDKCPPRRSIQLCEFLTMNVENPRTNPTLRIQGDRQDLEHRADAT